MTRVRFPHSAPILFLADNPTGSGNRTVNPDALRSSRRSAANSRPLMRQVSQPGCLPGESGSLPLVVAINARLAQTRRATVLQTEGRRHSICTGHHFAALDGDGPGETVTLASSGPALVRLQDAAPALAS